MNGFVCVEGPESAFHSKGRKAWAVFRWLDITYVKSAILLNGFGGSADKYCPSAAASGNSTPDGKVLWGDGPEERPRSIKEGCSLIWNDTRSFQKRQTAFSMPKDLMWTADFYSYQTQRIFMKDFAGRSHAML